MATSPKRPVTVVESGDGPYAQLVTIGRHIMCADEGEAAGGSDFGPSPYEYVMAGLGACTAMTLRMYAARHDWPLEKVSVVVWHKKVATADGKTLVDNGKNPPELSAKQLMRLALKLPTDWAEQRKLLGFQGE